MLLGMLGYVLGGAAALSRHRTEIQDLDMRATAAALREAVGIELNSPTTVWERATLRTLAW